MKILRFAVPLVTLLLGALGARGELRIDGDYPGGNIVVESVDGNTVKLRQDLRDTEGWWFYWSFQVRGAEGKTVTFRFTNKDVLGTRGPAMSADAGRTWSWLGTGTVRNASFTHAFPADAGCVRFAFAPSYQETDLQRFLNQHRGDPHLVAQELCRTEKGRPVERIAIGPVDGPPKHRVLLTCRHHCCESVASYVLEGMLGALLADTDDGRWFRKNVGVMAVPFMDKDGVEQGDQGKNRKPHDHNRDYEGRSRYASVAALREFVPRWSEGRLRVALDLHCPYIRGEHNEAIYLVGSRKPEIWAEQCAFGKMLEAVDGGVLPYRMADNLPYGQAWNTAQNEKGGMSESRWAGELKGIRLATSIETPYANVGAATVTPDNARAFGAALVRALRRYLEPGGPSGP